MDSDLQLHHRHRLRHLPPINQQQNVLPQQQQQHQQQQMNSGLMRYRSAPSSYFADILNSVAGADDGDGDDFGEILNHRPPSPETDRIFERFLSSGNNLQRSSQFMETMMQESEIHHLHHQPQQQHNAYSSPSQIVYQNQSQNQNQNQSQPSVPNQISVKSSSSMDDNSSMAQMKMGGGGGSSNSNLIRHSSSPAGLFADINVESGMLKGPTNFTPGPPSSSGLMTRPSEIGGKSKGRNVGGGGKNSGGYITGYPVGSWDDSVDFSDNYLEIFGEDDKSTIGNNQAIEGGNRPPRLSHHLSLPKSSAELSGMDKLLQFQDSVPCKIRAKRGFATHPRSIAERVRRTRISERMRKLQVLVPNMDKQTNTADMLDLAVDYIKDLQTQVKELSNKRAKCTCSHK